MTIKHYVIILVLFLFVLNNALFKNIYFSNFKAQFPASFNMKLQAIEIADNYSFNLDRSDIELAGDYMEYRGHKYHPYAPMATFISSLSYLTFYKMIYSAFSDVYYNYYFNALFKSVSFSLIEILIFTLAMYYFYRLLRIELSLRLSVLGILLLSFASLATAYLPQVNHHILGVSFIIIALYYLKQENFLKVGFFGGLAFLSEYPTLLFLVIVCLFNLRGRIKNNIFLILGFLPTLIIYFFNNYIVTGNILVTPEQIYDVNARFLNKFSFYNLPTNFILLLFSTSKSIFLYHPYLLFLIIFYKDSLYTIKYLLHQSYSKVYIIFSILITSLYLLWNDCLGGPSFGNRYFITVIPLAIFLLMKVLNRIAITRLRLAFIVASICLGYLVNQTLSYTNLSMIYNRLLVSDFSFPYTPCENYYFFSFPKQILPKINLSLIELKPLSGYLSRYSETVLSIVVFSIVHILNLILGLLLLNLSKSDYKYGNRS